MPDLIRETHPRARKRHWCQMCTKEIRVDELHSVRTYAYDGRVYNWRTCAHCERDAVTNFAYRWAGDPDDGVSAEEAVGWATDSAWSWPTCWISRPPWGAPITATERAAARAWLARAAGGEGE